MWGGGGRGRALGAPPSLRQGAWPLHFSLVLRRSPPCAHQNGDGQRSAWPPSRPILLRGERETAPSLCASFALGRRRHWAWPRAPPSPTAKGWKNPAGLHKKGLLPLSSLERSMLSPNQPSGILGHSGERFCAPLAPVDTSPASPPSMGCKGRTASASAPGAGSRPWGVPAPTPVATIALG